MYVVQWPDCDEAKLSVQTGLPSHREWQPAALEVEEEVALLSPPPEDKKIEGAPEAIVGGTIEGANCGRPPK